MRPLLGVLLLLVVTSLVSTVSSAPSTPAVVTQPDAPNEQKLLLECQNSDYRTYIKCLKRQKRQHTDDSHCIEGCLKKCLDHEDHAECDKKCAHCSKKTKHRHQIITEYESECTSGDCSGTGGSNSGLSTTNITTNIDINNIINTNANNNSSCCPTCTPPRPCTPEGPNPYPVPGPGPGPYWPNRPPPQLTLVPQLTLGLGLGFSGGNLCTWPYNTWPCVPPSSAVDCSGCHNPFLHYKCDVSCYPVQHSTQRPCQSPHCVGGTR